MRSGGGSHCLDVCIQTALMTSSLVLGDDAFVSHAVDDRHCCSVGGLCFLECSSENRDELGTNKAAYYAAEIP